MKNQDRISFMGRFGLLSNCAVESKMHFTNTFRNELTTCLTNKLLQSLEMYKIRNLCNLHRFLILYILQGCTPLSE